MFICLYVYMIGDEFIMINTEEYDTCSSNIIHENVLKEVKKNITNDDTLLDMSVVFKALSDATRLKIINALMISEMCVCDITDLLNMTQPAVSHHLKSLRQIGLIKFRREGKNLYYYLDNNIQEVFKKCLTYVTE